jgi:hypothetical protein
MSQLSAPTMIRLTPGQQAWLDEQRGHSLSRSAIVRLLIDRAMAERINLLAAKSA